MRPRVSLYWFACCGRTTPSPQGLHLSCSPLYPGPCTVLDTRRVLRNIYYLNEWWNIFSIPILLLHLSFNFPASPASNFTSIQRIPFSLHRLKFKKKKNLHWLILPKGPKSSVWNLMTFTGPYLPFQPPLHIVPSCNNNKLLLILRTHNALSDPGCLFGFPSGLWSWGGGGPLSSPAHPSHQHSPRGTIISVLHDPAVIVYLCREENRVKKKKNPQIDHNSPVIII